uniref:Scaffolding protein n=1 Tax=viral metagenome TaxID=1070528 RepID=A0A6M3IZK2_9ZZZZ
MVDLIEDKDDVVDDKDTKDIASETYLGDWKTREEAEKGFNEHKNLSDRQGNELGTLRKQVTDLTDTLTQIMQSSQGRTPVEEKGLSAEDELTKTLDEYGKLDFFNDESAGKQGAELLKKAILLTARSVKDETLRVAENQISDTLTKRDAEAIKQDFLKANPNFTKLQKSGAFQALKSNNPLHDDFSAYYETLAQEKDTTISELQAALNEAKKAANLAGGDTRAGKIFTKPGGSVRSPDGKPKTPQDRFASAAQAVLNATAAKGGQ